MKPAAAPESFFIGWDVGGWNCDRNRASRDAIVILDGSVRLVGKPWRGNLRQCISDATTTLEWLRTLFALCDATPPEATFHATMAIDTPLGFSEELVALITCQNSVEPDETSGRNRYLFRHTERNLFDRGLKPLSAIKDMIGSQATKGMHVLAKFAPVVENCGVWTDGAGFRAIETYPTACRGTNTVKRLLKGRKRFDHDDKNNALICALVAHLFATDRGALDQPPGHVPHREGWIWVPQQA